MPTTTFVMGCNPVDDTVCAQPGNPTPRPGEKTDEALAFNSPLDEWPPHEVTVSAFFLDTTHVTQAAYKECVEAGVCSPPTNDWAPDTRGGYPVHFVSWTEADQYCRWAGKRLPTEAEFEVAARGTDGRVYPWGDEAPDCTRANFAPGGVRCSPEANGTTLAPAGSYPDSHGPYGHLDMAGNLWNWTHDGYDPNYYASSPTLDPQGAEGAPTHAKRGGSLIDESYRLRTSRRWEHSDDHAEDIGFRCAQR